MKKFIITEALNNNRLDKALVSLLPDKSRTHLVKCINEGKVLVNAKVGKASLVVKTGDEIEFEDLEKQNLDVIEQNLNLDIVYEDADVAVVNKPKGMVVHPAVGNYENTLVNGLLYELEDLATINGVVRPGIVHRIDKDTSGLLMIAKNDKASLSLTQQLKDHACKRHYQALVYGTIVEDRGKINAPIGRDSVDRKKMAVTKLGKEAITHFKVLKRYKGYTLLDCELETGRTHQIRVHLAYIGHPLVGDKVYGRRKSVGDGQFLHAKQIGFKHPTTGEWLEFDSELPKYFTDFLQTLEEL